MHLFYSPQPIQLNSLDEQESVHALKVLRMKPGDTFLLTDGKGSLFKAVIADNQSKKCTFNIIETLQHPKSDSFYIHIAIAPTKNIDRMEWFVEKSIELGIHEISFIKCMRSERKHLNEERISKIAISAMKQSGQYLLPQINPMVDFKNILVNESEGKYIGHLDEETKTHLKQVALRDKKYLVLIGPEGDFSPEEINLAKAKEFKAISLGNSRLRTETAGIAACHILNLINT